jgi:hypothetical protein
MAFLIEAKDIDKIKWQRLVDKHPNHPVYLSWYYFENLAENWCIYVDEDYTYALPFAYKKQLGVRNIYPPFFQSYTGILGDASAVDFEDLSAALLSNFQRGTLFCQQELKLHAKHSTRVYQVVSPETYRLKDLAKRMLKKAGDASFEIREDGNVPALAKLIFDELGQKLSLYKSVDELNKFKRFLMDAMKGGQLLTWFLYQDQQLVGGAFVIYNQQHFMYLKGACLPNAKEQGGMYFLINELIKHAHALGYSFDFGGSNDENVRQFNTRFSAEDMVYHRYDWNHAPIWYKWLQKLNLEFRV